MIFCARCIERAPASWFPVAGGCPHCLRLCCCASASDATECDRPLHCYKRCPALKKQGLTGAVSKLGTVTTADAPQIGAWIEENHEGICRGNRAVANLIDTLTGVYLSAIYKLRNLK